VMADRVILVFIVVLAAVYFYATAQIPSLEIGDPLGPKAFPRLLGIALVVTGAMLFAEIVRARREKGRLVEKPKPLDHGHLPVIAAVVAFTAVYLAFFDWLGYVLATTPYLLGLMAYFHRGKWLSNILTSVLFSVLSYVLFTRVLEVSLARGILPF
jgi:putative tricarboxylic transport membrane protein